MQADSAGDPAAESDTRASAVSQALAALLDRSGVPERQRLKVLSDVLGLAYQQVRRRWIGDTDWSSEELGRVARHFGEAVAPLLCASVDGVGEPATVQFGDVQVPGTIWVGRQVSPDERLGPLLAVRRGATEPGPVWKIVRSTQADDLPAYVIRRFVYEASPAPRIAVLDDDKDLAEDIARYLRAKGFDALAYHSAGEFREALAARRFDAYILDWLLGDDTAQPLLEEIRAADPASPILILTGKADAEDEALSMQVQKAQALIFDKPTRSASLYNALTLMLNDAAVAHRSNSPQQG